MIIRLEPIKKSNKREYIIIEAPGPDDFRLRVTEKDEGVRPVIGGKKKSGLFVPRKVCDHTWYRLSFPVHRGENKPQLFCIFVFSLSRLTSARLKEDWCL